MGLAIISSIIIALISPLFNIDFTFIFDNKVKLIVSIIILIVMAYMISFSWNKKMFKKSAREVLKVGDSLWLK